MTQTKKSSSFEVVSIDDHQPHSSSDSHANTHLEPMEMETERTLAARDPADCLLSPRARLQLLACYLLISGLLSLYFSLLQAGMESISLCTTVTSCLFYSAQGWPALGEQTIDLLVMSYISGAISVVGGVLGAFGLYAAYKKSASKVKLFARTWLFMIGMFIGSTLLTLFLTIIHKDRFQAQCAAEHDSPLGTHECGAMYVGALLGSLFGCLIGVTMIWCYGEDVVKYSIQLEMSKDKARGVESGFAGQMPER